MNVLVIGAHHDDLEVGCGATVAKMRDLGHQVTSLVFTHSGYSNANGEVIRSREDAIEEAKLASKVLDYELISFEQDTFDFKSNDENVVKILKILEDKEIDTVFTHFHGDTHPPHNRLSKMVIHACRQIPRVFGMHVNWYVGSEIFIPNIHVEINESQWQRKIEALKCYKTEFNRMKEKLIPFLDSLSINYGLQVGVKRAEAFYTYKNLWNI